MYEFDWSSIPGALPLLGKGLLVTLEVTLTAIVVGIVWGTLLAVARLGANPLLAGLAAGYVNLFRSVPLVMVILWFYLIVPQLLKAVFGEGIADIRLTSALVAFALFEAAYYSEIIRAGIQSVPRGQVAAGLALGFTPANKAGESFTGSISVSGTITATGDITAYSDETLKSDIRTISGALDLVASMRGVTFTRIDTGLRGVGVVAQELAAVIPEAVLAHDDGLLSVAYGNLVGVLIEAVKDLAGKVERLEART